MKHLNVAITSLELALEEVKKTENPKRIAEANNLLQIVWDVKEQLNENVPFTDIDPILDDIGKRVNDLMADVNSAGRHDII
jgi:hypothetical protein